MLRDAAVDLPAVGVPLDRDIHQAEALLRRDSDTSFAIRIAPAQVPNIGLRRPNSAQRLHQILVIAAA